jgi:hypothetical protein
LGLITWLAREEKPSHFDFIFYFLFFIRLVTYLTSGGKFYFHWEAAKGRSVFWFLGGASLEFQQRQGNLQKQRQKFKTDGTKRFRQGKAKQDMRKEEEHATPSLSTNNGKNRRI